MSKFRSGDVTHKLTPDGQRRVQRINIWVDEGGNDGAQSHFTGVSTTQRGPTVMSIAVVEDRKTGEAALNESQLYVLKSNLVRSLNGDPAAPADIGEGAFWSGNKGAYFLHLHGDSGVSRKALEVLVHGDNSPIPEKTVKDALQNMCRAHHRETPLPVPAVAHASGPATPAPM